MYWTLLLIFVVVPALEIGFFVWTGSYLGILPLISLIILSGVIGIMFVKYQGLETLRRVQQSLQRGEMPTEHLLDGICIIIGAALLIAPGFLTDLLGFLLVLPWTRQPFKYVIVAFLKKKLQNGGFFIYRRW